MERRQGVEWRRKRKEEVVKGWGGRDIRAIIIVRAISTLSPTLMPSMMVWLRLPSSRWVEGRERGTKQSTTGKRGGRRERTAKEQGTGGNIRFEQNGTTGRTERGGGKNKSGKYKEL